MSTKSDFDRLISNASAQITGFKNKIAEIDRKIERLKKVYEELGSLKDSFRSAQSTTEGIFEEKGSWQGDTQRSFASSGENAVEKCSEYYKTLDAAQDAVNLAIADLSSQKTDSLGIIDTLWGKIRHWRAERQNAKN